MPNLSIPLHHMPTYFTLLSESVFSSIAVFIYVVLNRQHVFLVLYVLKKHAYKGLVLKYFPGGSSPWSLSTGGSSLPPETERCWG